MQFLTTNAQMKSLEKFSDLHGVSLWELMQNAGISAGKEIKKIAEKNKLKSILFILGNGNNSGDAWVASKYLKSKGFNIDMFCIMGEPKTELAKKAMEESGITPIKSPELNYDIVVDAVFGTGFHGNLPENVVECFNKISQAIKISLDIPSGGNGTDGFADKNTFKADITLTFGFAKTGLYQYPLKSFCGKIIVCNIGFSKTTESTLYKDNPYKIFKIKDLKEYIKKRPKNSNKGSFGKLLCITGSQNMPGACAMSALSALKSGVGLTYVATAKQNINTLAGNIYEAVWVGLDTDKNGYILFNKNNFDLLKEKLNKSNSVLIGCGLGITEDIKNLVKWVIKNSEIPVILDADGINAISDFPEILSKAKSTIILTPHPGEMSRITYKSVETIQNSRITTADEFLQKFPKCVLVLKGAETIIASSNEKSIITTGNPGMAKGGSGDVLAGIISSFVAQGMAPEIASKAGAYIHGFAGDLAEHKFSEYAMLPTDIINELPLAFKEIRD